MCGRFRKAPFLRQLLKACVRDRYIAQNPFTTGEIRFLEERKERRQPHILTFAEQVRVLLIADPMLRALIWLLTETGMRIGEGLGLKWTDLDFIDDAVRVRVSKTPSGRRSVPLSEDLKAELLKWKQVIGSTSDYVFPKLSNFGTHAPTVRRAWTAALKLAGIPFFPITNCRATFASRLAACGTPDVVISQLLGHAAGRMLLQTYARPVDEFSRDAIRRLEAFRRDRTAKLPQTFESASACSANNGPSEMSA